MTKHNFDRQKPWARSRLNGQHAPPIERVIAESSSAPKEEEIELDKPRFPTFAAAAFDLEDFFAKLSGDLLRDFNEKRRPSFDPEIVISADARILVVDSTYPHTRNVFALRVAQQKDIPALLELARTDEDVADVQVVVLEEGSALARLLDTHFIRVPEAGRKR